MNPKFNRFDRNDLERGLRDMLDNKDYSDELRNSIRAEIIYRIEHPDYETDCRARKVLSGGYN